MSYDDPNFQFRPTAVRAGALVFTPSLGFADFPPNDYVLLNRRFENVGEFGYAYNPASTVAEQDPGFRVCDK